MPSPFSLAAFALATLAQTSDAPPPEGIVPVPDYSGTTLERAFLTGDWGGVRERWAKQGLTFDVQWTQFAQSNVSGGLDTGWTAPGSVDSVVRLDLLRAQVWPAMITMRVESRYGDSINGDTGLLLPSNSDQAFPLTDPFDADLLAAVTELNVIQGLPAGFALVLGKIQTFDGDPAEFASGRGRDQFQQFPLVFSSVTALTVPYSTLAAGALWQPNTKFNVSTTFMNTTDSSTTSGFDDIGEGTTWATEARFQQDSDGLPGGMNLGFVYAYDGDFRNITGTLQHPPGTSAERESDSWAAYWTGWQYLSSSGEAPATIDPGDGRPDLVGYGLFARFGFADPDTNPIQWSASLGFGGRGVGDRGDDTYGVAYFTNSLQEPDTIDFGVLEPYSGGVEGFYGYALVGSARLSFDAQWLQSAFDGIDDAFALGLRLNVVL
jgi:porin